MEKVKHFILFLFKNIKSNIQILKTIHKGIKDNHVNLKFKINNYGVYMHKNLKARKTPKVLYSFFTIQSNKITPKCQSSFVTTLDVIT